ncbi:MAG: hypothetical protein R2795_00305 [Saprospiraceae bacterium]
MASIIADVGLAGSGCPRHGPTGWGGLLASAAPPLPSFAQRGFEKKFHSAKRIHLQIIAGNNRGSALFSRATSLLDGYL